MDENLLEVISRIEQAYAEAVPAIEHNKYGASDLGKAVFPLLPSVISTLESFQKQGALAAAVKSAYLEAKRPVSRGNGSVYAAIFANKYGASDLGKAIFPLLSDVIESLEGFKNKDAVIISTDFPGDNSNSKSLMEWKPNKVSENIQALAVPPLRKITPSLF